MERSGPIFYGRQFGAAAFLLWCFLWPTGLDGCFSVLFFFLKFFFSDFIQKKKGFFHSARF